MTWHGPGPIITPDVTDPNMVIVQHGNEVARMTKAQAATIPITPAWFTTIPNGLLATWPNRDEARKRSQRDGTVLGQIASVTITELRTFLDTFAPAEDGQTVEPKFVILLDPTGQPLPGA